MNTPINDPDGQPSPWSQPTPPQTQPSTTGPHGLPPGPGASPYGHPGNFSGPPFGQPPYPPQSQFGQPRFISPNQLRPARWLYAVAVAIFLLSICGGIGGFIAGTYKSASKFNENEDATALRPGIERTVDLDKEKDLGIFVEQRGSTDPDDIACTGTSEDGRNKLNFIEPDTNMEYTDKNRTVTHIYSLSGIGSSGEYTILCTGSDLENDAIIWVAEKFDYTAVGVGAVALIGAPCLGFIAAGTISLVVGLRRKSHKERLLRGMP